MESLANKARFVWGVVLLILVLFIWLPCPVPYLWVASVGAPELGVYFVFAAIPLLLGRSPVVTRILGVVVVTLALSPWVVAFLQAQRLPDQLARAFETRLNRHPLRGLPLYPEVRLKEGETTTTYIPGSRAPSRSLQLVVIHGGGWRAGERHQHDRTNRYYASLGYRVTSLDYRLAPQDPYPAAYQDVVAECRKLEGPPLVLLGRSAGGHLALLASYRETELPIAGVVGIYAPVDLIYSFHHPSRPSAYDSDSVLRGFLGGGLPEQKATYQEASPLQYVGSGSVPTLIVHGQRDDLVWPAHAEMLAQELGRHQVPHFVLRLAWMNHGGDFIENGPSARLIAYSVESFLKSLVRSPSERPPPRVYPTVKAGNIKKE